MEPRYLSELRRVLGRVHAMTGGTEGDAIEVDLRELVDEAFRAGKATAEAAEEIDPISIGRAIEVTKRSLLSIVADGGAADDDRVNAASLLLAVIGIRPS